MSMPVQKDFFETMKMGRGKGRGKAVVDVNDNLVLSAARNLSELDFG
jgi:hypothetical protein